MQKSESIAELAKALVKAQSELKVAKKTEVNPFFKSKYADLQGVWDACSEALKANGLAVTQLAESSDSGQAMLETVLLHESGEWIKGRLPLMPSKPDPQSQGTALTYARRYSLAAIVGVVTEDDDGEGTTDHKTKTTTKADPKKAQLIIDADWLKDSLIKLQLDAAKHLHEKYKTPYRETVIGMVEDLTEEQQEEFRKEVETRLDIQEADRTLKTE